MAPAAFPGHFGGGNQRQRHLFRFVLSHHDNGAQVVEQPGKRRIGKHDEFARQRRSRRGVGNQVQALPRIDTICARHDAFEREMSRRVGPDMRVKFRAIDGCWHKRPARRPQQKRGSLDRKARRPAAAVRLPVSRRARRPPDTRCRCDRAATSWLARRPVGLVRYPKARVQRSPRLSAAIFAAETNVSDTCFDSFSPTVTTAPRLSNSLGNLRSASTMGSPFDPDSESGSSRSHA